MGLDAVTVATAGAGAASATLAWVSSLHRARSQAIPSCCYCAADESAGRLLHRHKHWQPKREAAAGIRWAAL